MSMHVSVSVETSLHNHYKDVRRRLFNPPKSIAVINMEKLRAAAIQQEKKKEERRRKDRERAARKRALLGPISPSARRGMNGIAREVTVKYGMSVTELKSSARTRDCVCCKCEFVWAVNFYLPHITSREIAKFLNKDRTTILHAMGTLKKPQPDYIIQLKKYLGTIYVTKTEHGGVYRKLQTAQ